MDDGTEMKDERGVKIIEVKPEPVFDSERESNDASEEPRSRLNSPGGKFVI